MGDRDEPVGYGIPRSVIAPIIDKFIEELKPLFQVERAELTAAEERVEELEHQIHIGSNLTSAAAYQKRAETAENRVYALEKVLAEAQTALIDRDSKLTHVIAVNEQLITQNQANRTLIYDSKERFDRLDSELTNLRRTSSRIIEEKVKLEGQISSVDAQMKRWAEQGGTGACQVYNEACAIHGFYHGAEACELREGIERILESYWGDEDGQPLRDLLDEVDARDSLARQEAQNPKYTKPRAKTLSSSKQPDATRNRMPLHDPPEQAATFFLNETHTSVRRKRQPDPAQVEEKIRPIKRKALGVTMTSKANLETFGSPAHPKPKPDPLDRDKEAIKRREENHASQFPRRRSPRKRRKKT